MPTTTTASLLPVTVNQTALALAQTMFGDGISILSASYTGDPRSAGIYTSGETISPGAVPSDSGVILSTGLATQFTNTSGVTNQTADRSTNTTGINGDTLLNEVAGIATFDAAIFEASFMSTGPELTMRLVFGSEEYLEWVNSGYNDAVGIWINGERVMLSLGDGTISIDNINPASSENLYRDNADGSLNTEMDGLTFVLTLKAPVLLGQPNTIRIGIADAGDSVYDSALLIVADSVQSALIAQDDTLAVTGFGHKTVDLIANDTTTGRVGVHISAINDIAVSAGDVVKLNTGDAVRLEADGRVTFLSATLNGLVTFSYTITDAAGVSDTAFVTFDPQAVDGTEGDDSMLQNFLDAQGNIIDGADGATEAIFGYGGHDKIFAGLGDDLIYGGSGNDFIRAGSGYDLLEGGTGDDVLDGESGADTMIGGTGNDVYYIDHTDDLIVEEANNGYDKVISDLSHNLGATLEELWLRADSAAPEGRGNALNNKIVGNDLDNSLWGEAGADNIIAGLGHDSVYGGLGQDVLYGGAGNDLLDGGEGNDKLYGDNGQNTLSGGAGNDSLSAGKDGDLLNGGAGNDLLGGGSGADTFLFANGSGTDTVKNFDLTQDRLVFDGIQSDDLILTQSGNQLTISWGGPDKVIISGWTPIEITSAELPFDFI